MTLSVFWFRRDLRLSDNVALFHALKNTSNTPVLPIFIFDSQILNELQKNDARVTFIHKTLQQLNAQLNESGSSLLCLQGDVLSVWSKLIQDFEIKQVFTNKDYEPYAIDRDKKVQQLLTKNKVQFLQYKDQVIFEENDILKADQTPYTIFTPYKNKWRSAFSVDLLKDYSFSENPNFYKANHHFPSLAEIGFETSQIIVKPFTLSNLQQYEQTRNLPELDAGSYLSVHLRFGNESVRQIMRQLQASDRVFMNELIWREFFMQILFHFPKVVSASFKAKYDSIAWLNKREDFEAWCNGTTGYPMVDAGMRELNQTGYMHNRVRMVTASFLCKHLLIDWRWGEAYFAKKLLDFDLSANNGNWQWAAGTGCDAAPYFRVFNPTEQQKKFDAKGNYIKKWIPEFATFAYPKPIVEHTFARQRAIETYKKGINF